MAATVPIQLLPLAVFKPIAATRAWQTIPNPNGLPLIASAIADKTVRVYSLKNFTLHSVLEGGHSRAVRSLAWEPKQRNNGTLCIATGSFDYSVGIWRRKEETSAEEDGPALEVEVTSDGIKQNGNSKAKDSDADSDEDAEEWEFSLVLDGHGAEVKSLSWSPSGQYLASCARDKQIWIWEDVGEEGADDWETIAVIDGHEGDVKCVCWRKDDGNGEVLASASYDDTIRLWRDDGEDEWCEFANIEGHEGTVWSLDWEPEVSMNITNPVPENSDNHTPRTARLLSSSADCTIRVWTKAYNTPLPNRPSYLNSGIPSTMRPPPATETWECTSILPKVHNLPVYGISWSKTTGRVVSTGGDGKIAIYEERTKGRTSVGGAIEREWVVLAVVEGAHGPYEVNHVTWCTRYDAGRKSDTEEMVISTGDDGHIKAWAIEEIASSKESQAVSPERIVPVIQEIGPAS